MSTFVEVSAERLVELFRECGAGVERKGGTYIEHVVGRERVFDLAAPNRPVVRVYSSLAVGADAARDCGKDAVRVVVGVETPEGWRRVLTSRKILRTAPRGVSDREGAFLERLRGALRDAWAAASRVPRCPACGAMMAIRKGKRGRFWGCVNFPECSTTRRTT